METMQGLILSTLKIDEPVMNLIRGNRIVL